MTRFIHLALLIGLVSFSTLQITACGDDDKKDKKEDKDDEDEDGDGDGDGDGAQAKSPADVCSHMKTIAEKEGEEVSDEDMKGCEKSMDRMKEEIGDKVWSVFSSCAVQVTDEDGMDECGEKAEEAAEDEEENGEEAAESRSKGKKAAPRGKGGYKGKGKGAKK